MTKINSILRLHNGELTKTGSCNKICNDSEAIPLHEIKNFIRVDNVEDDEMIKNICAAAIYKLEDYTRVAITKKTYKVIFTDISSSEIKLPASPVSHIDSIQEMHSNNFIPKDKYYASDNRIFFKVMPPPSISVRYTAGMAETSEEIVGEWRNAILEIIAQIYEMRGSSSSVSDKDMEKWRNLCRYNLSL